MAIRRGPGDVLVVVDVQADFLPGGALAVPNGDAVLQPLNALARRFDHVVLTQDWHPAGHVSFVSRHPERRPFDTVPLSYGEQVLWPDHCVQGTPGAQLADGLDVPHASLVIRKGHHPAIDSYSAFLEADRRTRTGLAGYLRERGLTRLFVAGLATDYCVAWTALDGRALGWETYVVEDASRGIDLAGSLDRTWGEMRAAGVQRVNLADFA